MSGRPPARRFTLLDGLVLVGATAVGLGAARAMVLPDFDFLDWMDRPWIATLLAAVTVPVVWGWSWAFLALRLRAPRSPWRLLFRQPGWIASFAAVVAPLGEAVHWASHQAHLLGLPTRYDPPRDLGDFFYRGLASNGLAVAFAWTLLKLSGRWRAEPTWIDRFGRALGWAWIAATPVLLWLGDCY